VRTRRVSKENPQASVSELHGLGEASALEFLAGKTRNWWTRGRALVVKTEWLAADPGHATKPVARGKAEAMRHAGLQYAEPRRHVALHKMRNCLPVSRALVSKGFEVSVYIYF